MPMALFYSLCPEVAVKETRVLTIRGNPDLPDAEYGFLELYCNDVGCDCRRVVIQVTLPDPTLPVLATINYGWESQSFYTKWMKSKELAREVRGAALDPLNVNSALAPMLLDLFVNVVADDAYIERLKRHYALFKAALTGSTATPARTTSRMPLKKLKGTKKRRP